MYRSKYVYVMEMAATGKGKLSTLRTGKRTVSSGRKKVQLSYGAASRRNKRIVDEF